MQHKPSRKVFGKSIIIDRFEYWKLARGLTMGLSSQWGLDKNATAQDPSSSRALHACADRLAPEQDAAPPTVRSIWVLSSAADEN